MGAVRINYTASPVLCRFHKSDAFVRGVMGPIGSGKSSAMCLELLVRSLRQVPGPDGVRRTRFAIIRNSYPELKSTTIKTFSDWVPESICPIKGGAPISGRMCLPLEDGTQVDMEILFLALDHPDDAKKLLSLELSGAWVNEAREIDKSIIDALTGRVGRYPAKRNGGPSWSGVIMDTNPPDDDHWWYTLAEVEQPKNFAFFRQPGALLREKGQYVPNPEAENADNQPLGYDYWLRQVDGKPADWIDVYVLGRYGTTRSGNPVYPEYEDSVHLASRALEPMPEIPLILGWDFGLTPACVVTQTTPSGRFTVLYELESEGMGIRQFANEIVKPFLSDMGVSGTLLSVGDPAGAARSQTDGRTCLEELHKAGIPTRPAPTNSFLARREAVAGFLLRRLDGGPGFVLSPACKTLRKGFLSGYHYGQKMSGEPERPAKNRFSHPHDALQYAALMAEHNESRRRPVKVRRRHAPAESVAGY